MPPASRVAYNEVSTVLWEERELLDGLAFSLEMQRLVLLPGHGRWVPRVCREVELSLDRLRPAQLARAVQVEHLALELGLDPSPSLRVIVDVAEEPWNDIFESHRQAFLAVTREIVGLAEHNRTGLGHTRAAFLTATATRSFGSVHLDDPEDDAVWLPEDDR